MWMEHVSQLELLKFILYGGIVGAVLAAVYDCFRIIRMVFSHNHCSNMKIVRLCRRSALNECGNVAEKSKFWFRLSYVLIFIQDVLFSVISAMIVSVTVFNINSGRPRWFIFLGVVSGFAVYRFTLGKLVMKISSFIIRLVEALIVFVFSVTFLPMLRWCKNIYKSVYKKMRRKAMIQYGMILVEENLRQAEIVFGFDCSSVLK